MAITLVKKAPGDRVLELGGGANPNPATDVNVDVRSCKDEAGNEKVHFNADFEKPLPIADNDFEVVFSQFVMEHVSYRALPQFVREMFRVLKPGGRCVAATPNAEAQFQWIKDHPEGWDDRDSLSSFSCVIFGDQDYPENTHRSFLCPTTVYNLFQQAGFQEIQIQPYGERNTDLVVRAVKPLVNGQDGRATPTVADVARTMAEKTATASAAAGIASPNQIANMSASEKFDSAYFGGGGKVGGYAREGYWDYPVHEITAQHVLFCRPTSVLEIGCARGYILKRLQDKGIEVMGMEVSKHCYLTRALEDIVTWDLLEFPWPVRSDKQYDLCLSVAVLEHIPEDRLPAVLDQIRRVSSRGLHGIDFGAKDDGFDRTHCTLKPKSWWQEQFAAYGLKDHEIVDKEELELGPWPSGLFDDGGQIKLNIGCYRTMFHHGWHNLDILDCNQFAQQHSYRFRQHDCSKGLPYNTGEVDLIYASHFLEHLTYPDGLTFLRECRRVLKPDGCMRLILPDTRLIIGKCYSGQYDDFDEINPECRASPTETAKAWTLVHSGHQAAYDVHTLSFYLKEAALQPSPASFRKTLANKCSTILQETIDMLPVVSLYCDAIPVSG